MLTFGVLGPLEVRAGGDTDGDEEIVVPGPRLRTLLALLLVEPGRVVSTAQLSEALWGRDPPAVAAKTVQTYMSRLRRSLEGVTGDAESATIVLRAPGYRLQVDPDAVDAVRFARLAQTGRAALDDGRPVEAAATLREALALWRGDAYAEFTDQLTLRVEADRLEEVRRIAYEDCIDAELRTGAGPELVPELEKVLAADPHRERGWGQLMIALYRAGRQADALATFRRARNALIDGLGVEPSSQLRDLHARVLAQDPELLGRVRPPVRADPPPHEAPPPTEALPTELLPGQSPSERAPTERAPTADAPTSGRRTRRRAARRRLALGAGLAAAVVASAAIVVTTAGSHPTAAGLSALPANSVGELGRDGAILKAVPVGTDPAGVAYAGGMLWVANRSDATVSAVDPHSGQVVQSIQVGGSPEALTATAHDVWVTNSESGTVSQINIAARRSVGTIAVGIRPDAIASGTSGVWVANSGANTIQRIDPATGRAGYPIDVGDGPDAIAVDGTAVWVANGRDGTVSRIDGRTGAAVAAPVPVGAGPRSIVVSTQAIWVANEFSENVTRIDRKTGRTHTIEVGDGPQSIAALGSTLWVSNRFDGTLSRIDERSERVTTVAVGSSPRGLAVVGGHVWVASGPLAATAHRGGTLTVASNVLPGDDEGIDPAKAYLIPTIGPQRLVYDGLVGYRQADEVLVPDLAESIPIPTDGGRTYTFTLRPGIRYSTGDTVHVDDFVRGLQRALTPKPGQGRPDFFAGILGGKACTEHPHHCDLSRGVVVDNAARSITFHLAAADPEFLPKLTWFVFPTPRGTPLTALRRPLPGTGPYRISAFTDKKVYRLQRNRWFREWSHAAQPYGYPDVITWKKVGDVKAAAAAVIAGQADVAQLTSLTDRKSSQALVEDLRRRYPLQLHSDPVWDATYEVLDNREPPFSNPKARQAVNYAIDRRKLVDLYGGPAIATPTCQLLPPGFPSYQWYCPYTSGPQDGRYHGPDLAKARRLVQESGTAGMRVTIYTVPGSFAPPFDEYFGTVLAKLGYRVTVRRLPNTNATSDFLYDRRNHIQVMSYLWGADFPLASNFYGGTAACASSPTGFCNLKLEARAAGAAALQSSDPSAALRAWTAVDRAVTDAAAVVPGVTWRDWRFVSARVGNYQASVNNDTPLSQLWVR